MSVLPFLVRAVLGDALGALAYAGTRLSETHSMSDPKARKALVDESHDAAIAYEMRHREWVVRSSEFHRAQEALEEAPRRLVRAREAVRKGGA